MKLLILPNFGKERTIECLKVIRSSLAGRGCELMMQPLHKNEADDIADTFDYDVERMVERCDAVIAIGGDGTMMHAAKFAAEAGKPVLGVNTGRLGFLTGLESSELSMVTRLVDGDYSTESRMMLDIEVLRGSKTVSLRHAINEAVVSRGALSRVISLDVHHNGQNAMVLRADGLIISTPTGSTAYAMSAGGPIIDPTFRCIEVTPVCPHSLMDRSIIFDSDSELTVKASYRADEDSDNPASCVTVSVDGEVAAPLGEGEVLRVKRSALSAQFIVIKKQSFANALLQKFIN